MWIWALQESSGQTLAVLDVLSGATARTLSFKRSAVPELKGTLDIEHDNAYSMRTAVESGIAIIRAFHVELQADASELAVCRFAGIVQPLDEKANAGTMEFTARGAAEWLEGRFIGDVDVPFVRDQADIGDLLAELVETTNTLDGPTGIEVGDIETSIVADIEYENKRISDAVTELTGMRGAPDIEWVPVADAEGQGPTLARLEVYARQGTYRPEATFGYGPETIENCTDASRTTMRPRNRVIVYGDEGLTGFAEDADSIATFGLWQETDTLSDVIDTSLLDARAEELLRPTPDTVIGFDPDPNKIDDDGNLVTPQPWRDYWLGDTVPLLVRKGAFQYNGAARVDGIDITLDDDGNESSHTVTIASEGA